MFYIRNAGDAKLALTENKHLEFIKTLLAAQPISTETITDDLRRDWVSASRAAIRAEHKLIVQEALNGMDPIDREALTLRHFEHLSNDETALVLGLTKTATSGR